MATKTLRFNRSEGRRSTPRAQTRTRALPAGADHREVFSRRERFSLAHHPDSWTFRSASTGKPAAFLPEVTTVRVVPGVAGTGANRAPTKQRMAMEADGFFPIDEGDPRLKDFAFYNVEWPVDDGGVCYEFAGVTPIARGNKVIWRPGPDWKEFLEFLPNSGIIPPIEDFVMEAKIAEQEKLVQHIGEGVVSGKRSKAQLEQAEADLADMRAILKGYQEDDAEPDAEPEPAAKPAPKKASK